MSDGTQFVTGHCRITYLPTVLLGRPVIVRARRLVKRKRVALIKAKRK